MPPPVLSEEIFFPFPAVVIVERSVSGYGAFPSASVGVAMQGEAPDMPPPVLSVDRLNATSGTASTSFPDIPDVLPA